MKLENMYKRNANPKLYEEEQDLQNCGSFALGVDGWYCPYIEHLDVDEDDEQVGEDVIVVDRNQGELDISQLIYDYVYLHLPLKKVHPDGECDPEMMEKMKDILK